MKDLQKKNTLVTCCIPCYNHENYIRDAIFSVINQTYENIELIVIDDGSSDNSVEEIKKTEDLCRKRFVNTTFIFRENKGVSYTLNQMLSLAKGEYISFLASDDEFLPEKIDFLLDKIKFLSSDYCAVFGDAKIFSENDITLSGSFIKRYNNAKSPYGEVSYESILHNNYLPAMSGLYVRDSILSIGGFSNELRLEDWDIYLKLLQRFKIKLFPEIVAKYRLHDLNSILIENTRLLKDTLFILQSQREYAFSCGFDKIWYWKLYDTYYALMIKKSLQCKDIHSVSIFMLITYLLNKLRKRFL